MRKNSAVPLGAVYAIGLALLTGCGVSSTPSTQNLPAGWTVDFELGTVNLPDNPNLKEESARQQQQLISQLKQLQGNSQIQTQAVSGQFIQTIFQFKANQKAPESSVYVKDSVSNSNHLLLSSGQYWTDPAFNTQDNSKPVTFTVQYQGKEGTLTRTLNRNSKLPLPVFNKIALTSKSIEASWTAVPGAKSYLLQLVNSQNQLLQQWLTDGKTTSLTKAISGVVSPNSTYQLYLFAFGYEVHQTKGTPLNNITQPHVSIQSKTVTSSFVPGNLASYSPTSLKFEAATWRTSPEQQVVLKAGAAGLDFTYTLTAGQDRFQVFGNSGSLGASQTGQIPVVGVCRSETGLFTGELTILTSDAAKSSLKIPLSISCTKAGSLSEFSFLNGALNAASNLNSTVNINGRIAASYDGLQYSFEVLSGKEFITVPAAVTSLDNYGTAQFSIGLACGNTATLRQGKVRLKTNDPQRANVDFDVNLKCFVAPVVKELWSKPNNLPINTAAWNPSGSMMAVADRNYSQGLVLLDSKLAIKARTTGLTEVPSKLGWISDSKISLVSRDVLQIWDTNSQTPVVAWSHDFNEVSALDANRTLDQLALSGTAVGGITRTVVYSQAGVKLGTFDYMSGSTFSPDGKYLAGYVYYYDGKTSSIVNAVRLYDTANLSLLKQFDLKDLFPNNNFQVGNTIRWDSTSSKVFALISDQYVGDRGLLTYRPGDATAEGQVLKNIGSMSFGVKDTNNLIVVTDDSSLAQYNISTQTLDRKQQLPGDSVYDYRISTNNQASVVSAFAPADTWGWSYCSDRLLSKYNANLELQDVYGINACEDANTVAVDADQQVYVSNGPQVVRLSTGKASEIYDMKKWLAVPYPARTHQIHKQTGFFTDSNGYIYVFDFKSRSLVKSFRAQNSSISTLSVSPNGNYVATRSDQTYRVHDHANGNNLINRYQAYLQLQDRWTGPSTILLKNNDDSSGPLKLDEVEVTDGSTKTSYTLDLFVSGYDDISALNEKFFFHMDSNNIYAFDRATQTKNKIYTVDYGLAEQDRKYVSQIFTTPRSELLVSVLYTNINGTPQFHTVLMDAQTGAILKNLLTSSRPVRQVRTILDTNGKLLVATLVEQDSLHLFQVD